MVNLTTSNLMQDGGRWWQVLISEGQRTRRVKVHDTLYDSLEAWAKSAGMTLGEGERPLFFNLYKGGNPTGKELDYSVIGRIVAEYGSIAGLAPRYGENCLSSLDLRLTCARNAYDNGAPLHMIQALLGHVNVKTTMRFIGVEEQEEDADTAMDYIRY